MSTELTQRQQALYDALVGRGDVDIVELYRAMGGPVDRADDPRYAQQWLGSQISRINKRLVESERRIVPGRLKGTYTLIVTK